MQKWYVFYRKSRKEDVIKHKVVEEKDRKKQTIKIEKDEKRRQEEEARAKYEKWLERKVSLNIFRQHIWGTD
jgi:transcription antitermination factor NusG